MIECMNVGIGDWERGLKSVFFHPISVSNRQMHYLLCFKELLVEPVGGIFYENMLFIEF